MELIYLSGSELPIMNVRHIIDPRPTRTRSPDPEAIKALHKGRRSRYGVNQSEHSKHRQNFITGLNPNGMRMTRTEMMARKQYLHEFEDRLRAL